MSSLPDDLYPEILVRVPAESLLACKCVCKNWYALISTSQFVKSNLHFTTQKSNPILLLEGSAHGIQRVNYSLDFDSSVCEIEKMEYPFNHLDYHVQLLSSCNGLVCIQLSEFDGDGNFLCLWNPLTREFKKIPETPNEFKDRSFCIRSLVYDHKNDDYKFALGVEILGSMDSTLVQFYTLSSSSWNAKKTISYWFCEQTAGVLINGDLHWLVVARSGLVLLSLDIRQESFNEMQLPEELLEKDEDMSMVLGLLEGSLCALVSSYVNEVKIGYEVWKMLNYGVRESWTKLYVIAHESIISDNHYFRLVWPSKKGDILLLSRKSLVSYDPKHGSARELKIDARFLDAVNYFESLVSLSSGTYVGTDDD